MGESNVFTGVCLSAGGRGGERYPGQDRGTPSSCLPHYPPSPALPSPIQDRGTSHLLSLPLRLLPLSNPPSTPSQDRDTPLYPTPSATNPPIIRQDQDGCAPRAECVLRSRSRTFSSLQIQIVYSW